MSWFRAKKTSVKPDFTGLQLQTSVSSLPIPIVWGRTKAAANIVWYSNFQTVAQRSGGGKGGGGGSITSYSYAADVILALGEGPISGVGAIWKSQSTFTLSQLSLSLFNGSTPQTVWGYLAASNPAQALAYQGTAYVAGAAYALGSGATLQNHNFEIYGVLAGTGINGVDADPALVIQDFLTNAQYGAGLAAASINATTLLGASGDASLQTYCRALGIAFSPCLTSQEPASTTLSRWLQLLNCAAVWTNGQLKFIPYADASASGNGYTFTPNLTPVYNLTDLDLVDEKGNKDPIEASRVDPFSLPTVQRIECLSRSNQYGLTPVEARDQSQIETFGLRVGSVIQAHEICDEISVGPVVAQTILQRQLYVRARFAFKLSWEYCLLDPMDVVTLTDANLGLSNAAVRILSIEEDEKGLLSVTAEELTSGVSVPALYPGAGPRGTAPNQNVTPAPINPAPLIYEPPPAATGGVSQIWLGASGGTSGAADPNWGGCNVWLSFDNISYSQIAAITTPLRQGVLTAPLPAATGWDSADTLVVNLGASAGVLSGTSQSGAQAFATLSLVDGELISYQSATLTGANAYVLAGLQRGGYGTAGVAHGAGAPFARLDSSVVKYALPGGAIGQKLYLKFQSFNVFGAGLQSLSSCAVFTYSPTGASSADPIAAQLLASGGLVSAGGGPSGGSTAPILGTAVDLGPVSQAATVFDDFGSVAAAATQVLDLGSLTS